MAARSPAPTARRDAPDAPDALIDAKAAASMLGVKPQTLYSYVSRGLIRTAPKQGSKASLYHRDDVEAVLLKGRGRGGGAPGERQLRWSGAAVLHTAITSLTPQGPVYRGRPAVDLARAGHTFEDCAELLWSGLLPSGQPPWGPAHVPGSFAPFAAAIAEVAPHNSSRRLLALTCEAYTAAAGRSSELSPGAPTLAARQLIQLMACAFGLLRPTPRLVPAVKAQRIAAIIARSGGIAPSDDALRALDACLILSADHEFAPSTFAARIVASVGSDLFSCVNTALGAFGGQFTGVGCDESEAALVGAPSAAAYVEMLRRRLAGGAAMPGYNHTEYPGGDPRAEYLLALARPLCGRSARARSVLACIDAAQEVGARPSLAVGLVAVCVAIGLPRRSAGALMALGRTAGWVAHALEQRLSGLMVRPRARYIGSAYAGEGRAVHGPGDI